MSHVISGARRNRSNRWRAYKILYNLNPPKPLHFCTGALADLHVFPEKARKEAGRQLRRVQLGLDPHDWKPMNPVAPGAREIRIRDERGAFRVLYVAKIHEVVLVLHCFKKKTEKTAFADLSLARQRYRAALTQEFER
ncbi:type II toxin-antitoxin system RelE/ParE family toxin [Paraburkholderia sp. J69-1]|uniref:type II toxin-antitoxin system RelE/ParE family toxin n=1 Tax=unclassified Paraburkholderia TaxID=2615204 RepID=UPI0039EF8C3E